MSDLWIVSMILNLVIVVGGFLYFLSRALKNEKNQ